MRGADDRPAVFAGGRAWSGAELRARAAGAADWLDAIGATPGAPIAALLGASADALALAVAGALWERPLAPLGPRGSVEELTHCVRGLGATVLVADRQHLDRAREVAARTGATAVALPPFPAGNRASPDAFAPDAVVMHLHTSGTTGLPKRVPVRRDRLAARTAFVRGVLGIDEHAVHVSAAGFHHISGLAMMLAVVGAGGAVVPLPTFSVAAWQGLRDARPTHALMVPSHLAMLLAADALDLGSLEALHYGASPIHPDTLRAVMTALPRTRLAQLYGQTEGSPITVLDHDDHVRGLREDPELLLAVGRAPTGVEVWIADADDTGVGELHARAPHLFACDAQGVLATGDLARLDDRGYVFLVGRRGDKLIRGGENVFPVEIERVLDAHPGVAEAAVFGVPDRRLGDRIVATVVAADPGAPPPVADLVAWCRDRLAPFKVPEEWRFVAALPRNTNGKLLRRELRIDD
jgi:acyl-CoA synthetase (AMP-forming)/AMP-acid ligase II